MFDCCQHSCSDFPFVTVYNSILFIFTTIHNLVEFNYYFSPTILLQLHFNKQRPLTSATTRLKTTKYWHRKLATDRFRFAWLHTKHRAAFTITKYKISSVFPPSSTISSTTQPRQCKYRSNTKMYSTKVQQSILYTTPNLKAVGFDKQIHTTRNYFFKYSFLIRQITLEEACSTLKTKLRALNKEKLIDALKNRLTAVPRSLKEHSSSALKVWARQCECVLAQRLRRGQQMFSLYTKLWEEHALREFLRKMRQHMLKRSKAFMLGAVGITSYNWDKHRIPEVEILKHTNEIR